MNCRDFERLVGDLARKQLMDEQVSRKALVHAESCTRCEGQLAEERILSARLRLLGVSMERELPPVKLETTLLSAYRRRILPGTRSLSTVPRNSIRPVPGNGRRVTVAAAAVLLSLVSLQWLLTVPSAWPTNTEEQPIQTLEQAENDNAFQERHRPEPLWLGAPSSSTVELATDFIPLVPCPTLDCLDGGQLMRVMMPRQALMLFGLPMNEQLVQESVTADVWVSGDGVARAIRFVR